MSSSFAWLFWLMMAAYAAAVALQIAGIVFRKDAWGSAAWRMIVVAFVAHSVLVGWRWVSTGHIPTIGNFENALMGSWFIVAMAAWAGRDRRYPVVAAGALPFALLILGMGALSDTAERPMVAALQSFWLYIHIFFAWLAYGAYTVACGTAVVYLVRSRAGAEEKEADLRRLDELMFRYTVFGFITDSIMIAAGSIWARDLWGSYWSWDPVETWSLLSWLVYGIALHLRVTRGWRGRKLAWVLIVAIIGVLVSFWGVNLVMEGSEHVFNVG